MTTETEQRCSLCKKPLAHPLEFHPKEACDKWLELTTNGEFDSDSAWRSVSAPEGGTTNGD